MWTPAAVVTLLVCLAPVRAGFTAASVTASLFGDCADPIHLRVPMEEGSDGGGGQERLAAVVRCPPRCALCERVHTQTAPTTWSVQVTTRWNATTSGWDTRTVSAPLGQVSCGREQSQLAPSTPSPPPPRNLQLLSVSHQQRGIRTGSGDDRGGVTPSHTATITMPSPPASSNSTSAWPADSITLSLSYRPFNSSVIPIALAGNTSANATMLRQGDTVGFVTFPTAAFEPPWTVWACVRQPVGSAEVLSRPTGAALQQSSEITPAGAANLISACPHAVTVAHVSQTGVQLLFRTLAVTAPLARVLQDDTAAGSATPLDAPPVPLQRWGVVDSGVAEPPRVRLSSLPARDAAAIAVMTQPSLILELVAMVTRVNSTWCGSLGPSLLAVCLLVVTALTVAALYACPARRRGRSRRADACILAACCCDSAAAAEACPCCGTCCSRWPCCRAGLQASHGTRKLPPRSHHDSALPSTWTKAETVVDGGAAGAGGKRKWAVAWVLSGSDSDALSDELTQRSARPFMPLPDSDGEEEDDDEPTVQVPPTPTPGSEWVRAQLAAEAAARVARGHRADEPASHPTEPPLHGEAGVRRFLSPQARAEAVAYAVHSRAAQADAAAQAHLSANVAHDSGTG